MSTGTLFQTLIEILYCTCDAKEFKNIQGSLNIKHSQDTVLIQLFATYSKSHELWDCVAIEFLCFKHLQGRKEIVESKRNTRLLLIATIMIVEFRSIKFWNHLSTFIYYSFSCCLNYNKFWNSKTHRTSYYDYSRTLVNLIDLINNFKITNHVKEPQIRLEKIANKANFAGHWLALKRDVQYIIFRNIYFHSWKLSLVAVSPYRKMLELFFE